MSLKNVVARQYQEKVDRAAQAARQVGMPAEGWICTVRKALNMSAAELARRLGKSRALVSKTEKAELDGGVTLKTMKGMAEAMGCRFVYAIVPDKSIEDLLAAQASKKACLLVEKSGQHMALEAQNLTPEQMDAEEKRIAQELMRDMPSDFWRDRS
ncbi:MAG: transcriptional regulator [Rhodospirillaceae bacterium]|nr:MAG: transcriptional regulator [Rhodospirillaceae bacterium]